MAGSILYEQTKQFYRIEKTISGKHNPNILLDLLFVAEFPPSKYEIPVKKHNFL